MLDLTKPISPAMLRADGACKDQVARAEELFGLEPQPLTRVLLLDAAAAGLDVEWLARFLEAPAPAEYEWAKATALAEYERAMATALADALELP